ncbi:hypothetical protein F7234_09490 [Pseudomonas putida]|uniref:hypothetical protein n=1 Tax=Pseudomonas putida TaxID=303 RepID=UPI00125F24F1|nr:hypothetical protein [Pseudomonas putida]KAB5624082.1 hypothetical protein F7234_09490 [Pseudomonas putida]
MLAKSIDAIKKVRFPSSIKKSTSLLRLFFINHFWMGIVLILIAIILDLNFPTPNRPYIYTTAINLIQAVGASVLIASIFTYASGTSEFVDKIRTLLEDIIVRRNFLGNIDPEGKKEALKAIIQPTAAEKNIYPNIGDYYGHFINKTLEIGSRSVRSNYQVNSRAFYDIQKRKIAVEGLYNYRLYPSNDGFADIVVGFEEDETGPSYCSYVAVSTPDGKRDPHPTPTLSKNDESGVTSMRASINIRDKGAEANHLDVEIKVTEYGSDHWQLITFKALQPTDGFRFHLRCDGHVRIQTHAVFVVGASYYVELDKEEGKWITIVCNQWINEGSGLSILIALPHEVWNSIKEQIPSDEPSSFRAPNPIKQESIPSTEM